MTQFVIANNVNTQLAAAASSGATTLTLASSANLPTLSAGQVMPLTLNDAATGQNYEIVYVTAISGVTLTVTRAQEGTGALNWSIGDYAYCAPTAATVATSAGSPTNTFQVAAATALTHAPEAGQVQRSAFNYAGLAGGTANALTATLTVAPGSYTDWLLVTVRVASNNTGGTSLNVNGLGVVPVIGAGHQPLQGGELVAGGFATFAYSTNYSEAILLESTGGAMQVGAATASQHAVQLGQVTNTASPLALATATPTQPTGAAQFQNIGNFQGSISVTTTTTLTSAIFGNYVSTPSGNAGGYTITLPSSVGNASKQFTFLNAANTAVTLSAGNFNSCYGSATAAISVPSAASITFECDGASYNGIAGSGSVGIAPRPSAATGPGNFVQIATASTYALPAGGTWVYAIQIFAAAAATSQGSFAGIAAGGATIFTASSNDAQGWAWRIQ